MAGAITDKIRKTRNGERPITTYLDSAKAVAATSIVANSLDNWTSDTAVDFVIFRVDANRNQVEGTLTTWKGLYSGTGTTITNLELVAGTDQEYAAGEQSVVMATPTAAWSTDIAEALLTHTDQDGTLKAGAVDNAAVLASNVVTTAKILDANVTTAKIADDAVTAAKLASPSAASTDANGWSVTDYGSFKVATKSLSTTASKIRFESGSQSSANLPVGVSTVADLKSYMAIIENGNFSDQVALTRHNGASTSTELTWIYMYLGPTTSTSYTVPVKFTVIW